MKYLFIVLVAQSVINVFPLIPHARRNTGIQGAWAQVGVKSLKQDFGGAIALNREIGFVNVLWE